MLGKTPAELSEMAASVDTSKPMPIFLPHLEGERAPLWDIHSRASLSGLSSAMGQAEMARAVLEGVGYSARLAMDSLEASACIRPEVIHHSGGGSASDTWCQIRADVLGRPIRRAKMRDAGVLGAAMMAGVGAGLFLSLREAAKSFVVMDRVFEPNASETERHERGFAQYQMLYRQLVAFNAA
jgi:xylulokinase